MSLYRHVNIKRRYDCSMGCTVGFMRTWGARAAHRRVHLAWGTRKIPHQKERSVDLGKRTM